MDAYFRLATLYRQTGQPGLADEYLQKARAASLNRPGTDPSLKALKGIR